MKNLYKALAAFQQEVPVIHKGTSGYGYSYADLPAIFETINPLMKKHGLGFTQLMESDGLTTIVFHAETGEQIASTCAIPQNVQLAKMNPFQVAGSAITYFRRYALSAMLGLVTDKDTDASGQATKTKVETVDPNALAANKFILENCTTKPMLKQAFEEMKPVEQKALRDFAIKIAKNLPE